MRLLFFGVFVEVVRMVWAEAFLLASMAGIAIFGGLWIVLYQALEKRLQALGCQGERRNGMDRLFSRTKMIFFGGARTLGDHRIVLLCLGLKLLFALVVICFLGMVFGPFLLKA